MCEIRNRIGLERVICVRVRLGYICEMELERVMRVE